MAAHTIKEVQTKLILLGFSVGPSGADGTAGIDTDAAVAKFQTSKGLQSTGTLDPDTLAVLFPSAVTTGPKTIQATAFDFLLNFLTSKTNWAAAALVAIAVGWINTRFGLQVPQEVQNLVTGLLVAGFTALIWLLQTFLNSPHVTTKQPAVVQQPSVTK